MKNFFIIINMGKKIAVQTAAAVRAYLESYDGVRADVWDKGKSDCYDVPSDCDCIITVGGDGTLLHAARAVVKQNVPIIGINCGHLGYMAELQNDEFMLKGIDQLLSDHYQIEERMMLNLCVKSNGNTMFEDNALNEVILNRSNSLMSLKFEVYVNGSMLNFYVGDGMLVSTPTGSTAYSLSAGGPIAKPSAKLMILTPLNAHSMFSRAIILAPEDEVVLKACSPYQLISCDCSSSSICALRQGDEAVIRQSEYVTKFIKLKEESFMETLRKKMTAV